MKKIFSIVLLVSVLVLVAESISAATTAPVKYTAEQQTCINTAIKDQASTIKPAQDIFDAATKSALAEKQAAIRAAQGIKDATAKTAAIKDANTKYNNDETVKAARVPYTKAFASFRADIIKKCTGVTGGSSFMQSLTNFVKKSVAALTATNTTQDTPAAANKTNQPVVPANIKYTVEQQACIKKAQDARIKAIEAAAKELNDNTNNALKIKQDVITAATNSLNAATKDALKVKQDAITAARDIKDVGAKTAAMKSANDVYEASDSVKKARVPYTATVKAANDAYNADAKVKQANAPYMAAVKAANDKFVSDSKVCLSGSKVNGIGFFTKIGGGIGNVWSNVMHFFSGKK